MHYGILDVNIYGAHRVGKHGVTCYGERPIVCTMTDETKWQTILKIVGYTSKVCNALGVKIGLSHNKMPVVKHMKED